MTVLSIVALIMSYASFEKFALSGVGISFLIAVGALLAWCPISMKINATESL